MERTNRSAYALAFGARHGVWTTRMSASPQLNAQSRAPFRVSIAEQHAVASHHAFVCRGERAADLVHEQSVGKRRRTDDVDASRRQINHKHGVVGHQATPCPDLGRKEVRACDRTPMGAEERLPRCGPARNGRRREPSRCERWSTGRRGAPHSPGRPGSACSPTWSFLAPCAPPGDEFPVARCGGRVAFWRTTTFARSVVDATGVSCRASRSSRPGVTPADRVDVLEQPADAARRRST
jgi:hypothetical protein